MRDPLGGDRGEQLARVGVKDSGRAAGYRDTRDEKTDRCRRQRVPARGASGWLSACLARWLVSVYIVNDATLAILSLLQAEVTMRLPLACVSALLAIAIVLAGVPDALAVPLSDQLVISANDRTSSEFPGFRPLSISIIELPEVIEDPISFPIGTRSGTHGATFNTAVALTEAGGGISDIIEFTIVSTNGVQTWTGQFISDSDRGSLALPVNAFVVTIPETGGVQDISADFLNSDGLTKMAPLFNVFVQSDAEVTGPSALLLLGSGLVALAGLAWSEGKPK